jgi:hypothetical protein
MSKQAQLNNMSEDQVADKVNYFISDSAAAITGEAFSIH